MTANEDNKGMTSEGDGSMMQPTHSDVEEDTETKSRSLANSDEGIETLTTVYGSNMGTFPI